MDFYMCDGNVCMYIYTYIYIYIYIRTCIIMMGMYAFAFAIQEYYALRQPSWRFKKWFVVRA